jgi:hypothetical protein
MTTGQVPTTKLETLFSQQNTLLIHLQVPQFLLNLLGLRQGSRYQFLFGPNNGLHQLRTHNLRKSKNLHPFQNPASLPLKVIAILSRFPSSPRYLPKASTLMIQIMTQHPELLLPMIIRMQTSTIELPDQSTPLPPLHLALHHHLL